MEKILDNYSRYIIYSNGTIWSIKYNKFLSPATTEDGYLRVVLYGDAERFLNNPGAHANIVRQLKGRGKSAYGYFWKYLEEN